MDLFRWMANLPRALKTIPFYKLILPGSHDSAAFNYLPEARFHGSKANMASKLPCAQGLAERWMTTQELNLYQQLSIGVRKLDLRISYDQRGDQFYFSHTFASILAAEGLKQIRDFLRDSPGEIVYIECTNDFSNSQTMPIERADNFLTIVERVLGEWLTPNLFNNRFPNTFTIENMVALNNRVIFDYRSGHSQHQKIWHPQVKHLTQFTSNLENKWRLINEFLTSNAHIQKNGRQNLDIALTLTPQTSDVVKTVFLPCSRGSVRRLTTEFHASMYKRLEGRDLSNINTLYTDFVSEYFVRWVLDHNLKLN